MKNKRDVRLDLIRTIATVSVISVHFLLNCGYYDTILVGKQMFIMTYMRTIFLNCVPLFIMLTGYLKAKKELTGKYYFEIEKILRIYLLICGCCILFKKIYLNEELTFFGTILSILNFTAVPYGWYVNMYIGLFLLTPFLNILYNALESKRKKQLLIGTFLILSVLPSLKIFPTWWIAIYPITYYYLGAYLREYGCYIKKSYLVIGLLGGSGIFTIFNFYYEYGAVFTEHSFSSYSGFECTILAFAIFSLCLTIKTEHIPNSMSKFLGIISKYSFGMYLSSWIVDVIVYDKLKQNIPNVYLRLDYAPAVIAIVFIGSFLISFFVLQIEKVFDCFIAGFITHIK